MCLVIIFMIIIYPQEMTFTSIIEYLEKYHKRLRGAQCADLRSVGTFPPPPREPGYEAKLAQADIFSEQKETSQEDEMQL